MRVILSYGLGVDSTAILVRWLLDPSSRDFELRDLTVVTAQVGHEFPDTRELVEAHVVPLLRQHGVRYVQVGRSGRSVNDWRVLSDTREPTRCHTEGGGFTLMDESLASATVPQKGGARKCSQKFKGAPLDQWIERELGGAPFRHAIGFELDERGRVARDEVLRHDAPERRNVRVGRHPEYPLVAWGWDRARCVAYLREVFGVDWPKSACTFCPFSDNARGLPSHVARLGRYPDLAAQGAMMEWVAMALNPRQPLYTLRGDYQDVVVGTSPAVAQAFERQLASVRWAVYRVRRAWVLNRKGKPQCAGRDVECVATHATREAAEHELGELARRLWVHVVPQGRTVAAVLRPKPDGAGREELYVVAPHAPEAKTGRGFSRAWEELEPVRLPVVTPGRDAQHQEPPSRPSPQRRRRDPRSGRAGPGATDERER